MMRRRDLSLVLGSILLGIVCFGFVLGATVGKDSVYRYLNVFHEVFELVRGNYVDPVNEVDMLEGAYRGMVGGLDPFSGYIGKDQFPAIQRDPTGGPAETGLEVLKSPGGATVVAVRSGSQADTAGLRPGDQIWAVDGVPARLLSLLQLRRAQRGAADSAVRLLVYHPRLSASPHEEAGATRENPLAGKREELRLRRTLPSGPAFESSLLEGKIAYLKLLSFERAERDALKGALVSLKQKGATRLLLDLRDCASGSVEDAVRVAGLFVSPGTVVIVQGRGGNRVSRESKAAAIWTLPIFVLQDGGTAGAAEILAAALRARARAQLLGETSYGLGSSQDLVPLPSGDGLVLSATKLIPPSGESWNRSGLKPDKDIPSTPEERAGLETDRQLEKALESLRAPAAAKAA